MANDIYFLEFTMILILILCITPTVSMEGSVKSGVSEHLWGLCCPQNMYVTLKLQTTVIARASNYNTSTYCPPK